MRRHPERPGQDALTIATEALERIADVRGAYHDSPGRTWSYRDYELRQIAKYALEKISKEHPKPKAGK